MKYNYASIQDTSTSYVRTWGGGGTGSGPRPVFRTVELPSVRPSQGLVFGICKNYKENSINGEGTYHTPKAEH